MRAPRLCPQRTKSLCDLGHGCADSDHASALWTAKSRNPIGTRWASSPPTPRLLPVLPMNDITCILSSLEQSDPDAAKRLLPFVYEELRRLAAQKLAHEKPGQTLQATALVHEAYLRLVDGAPARHWNSRGHFFAAAAEAMRRIL